MPVTSPPAIPLSWPALPPPRHVALGKFARTERWIPLARKQLEPSEPRPGRPSAVRHRQRRALDGGQRGRWPPHRARLALACVCRVSAYAELALRGPGEPLGPSASARLLFESGYPKYRGTLMRELGPPHCGGIRSILRIFGSLSIPKSTQSQNIKSGGSGNAFPLHFHPTWKPTGQLGPH